MVNENLNAYVDMLRTEHRELRNKVHEIQRQLDRVEGDFAAGTRVAEALHALAEHMRHHFRQEEEGGYLEEALAVAPRFHAVAARLLGQHTALLAELKKVADEARRAVTDGARWGAVRDRARAWLAKLLAHEACENRIVAEAFNVDRELTE